MPTERTRQQPYHHKDPSPPDEGYHYYGRDHGDPTGTVNGGHRANVLGGGGERSGLKAKLAAKWNRRRTDDSEKKQKQLQDYTAWVNNYLKKKPGTPLISDLRSGIQDGITLVYLVEIVAHMDLQDIDHYPTTPTARRNNIEKTLQFLRTEGVILHQDAVKDIMEGNSKGIMRVILALAERYQPRSVKQRSVSDPKPYAVVQQQAHAHFSRDHTPPDRFSSRDHVTPERPPLPPVVPPRTRSPDEFRPRSHNVLSSSLAANSFSVPNMASLNVHTRPSGGRSRPTSGRKSYEHSGGNMPHAQGYGPPQIGQGALSQPERVMEKSHAEEIQTRTYSLSQADMENDVYSTPLDQLPPSAGTRIIAPQKKLGVQIRVRSGSTSFHSIPEENEFYPAVVEGGVVSHRMSMADAELSNDVDAVIVGLSQFKTELLQLHALLLRNSDGRERESEQTDSNVEEERSRAVCDNAPTPTPTAGDHAIDQIHVAAASNSIHFPEKDQLLAQKELQIIALRDQLVQLQDEYTQLDSECAALRNMVEERNTFITTIKSEIYRKEYKNDTQRVDLHQQLFQKETIIKKLESELMSYRGSFEEQQHIVESAQAQIEDKERSELELKVELDVLKEELERLRCSEDTLQTRVAGKDKRIAHLEEKVSELKEGRAKRSDAVSEEAEGIRESLSQLRQSIPAQDSQQSAIDQLERHIAELMTKLVDRAASPTGKKSRRHRDYEEHHRDRDKEKRRRHRDKHSQYIDVHPTEIDQSASAAATTTTASNGQSSPVVGGANSGSSPIPGEGTKVIYYMLGDKKETPYSTVVPKKVNEITLHDFKAVFSRQGAFRYYIKVEDPDCGVVKEEIKKDVQLLPSWNGKILVWVAERGHHR